MVKIRNHTQQSNKLTTTRFLLVITRFNLLLFWLLYSFLLALLFNLLLLSLGSGFRSRRRQSLYRCLSDMLDALALQLFDVVRGHGAIVTRVERGTQISEV